MTAVLVVDDEAFAAEETAEALEAAGIEARWCSDPITALQLAEHPDIALVITDLRMPVLDGACLIERLRAARPHLRFIVVTGHASAVDGDAAQGDGIVGCFRKPVDVAMLAAAAQTALRESGQ